MTRTKTKTAGTLEAARQGVVRLAAAERDAQSELADVRALLDLARPQAAAAYARAILDGSEAPTQADADEMLRLERRAEAFSAAVDLLRDDRRAAIRAAFKAEAAECRAEAERISLEADAREAVTADLVAQLEQVEGCRFAPVSHLMPGATEAPAWLTRTGQQRAEAVDLRRDAARLENLEVVRDSGEVEAGTVDDLVAEATGNPFVIGPREDRIREWAATATGQAAPQAATTAPVGVSYVLRWKGGEILPGESRAVKTF